MDPERKAQILEEHEPSRQRAYSTIWGAGLCFVMMVVFFLLPRLVPVFEGPGVVDEIVAAICAVLGLGFLGVGIWRFVQARRQEQRALLTAQEQEEKEAYRARQPWAEELLKFANKQERFRGLYELSEEARQKWVASDGRRFLEVIRQWPKDFDEYDAFRAKTQFFKETCWDLWPTERANAEPFRILAMRKELYNWVRYKLDPQERLRLENEGKIRYQQEKAELEIAKAEVEARMRKERERILGPSTPFTDED